MKFSKWLFTALLFGWTAVGTSQDVSSSAKSSHQRMVEELATIAKWADKESPYTGFGLLKTAEKNLAQLPKDTPPLKRVHYMGELGWEYLRCGKETESIAILEKALAILDKEKVTAFTQIHTSLLLAYLRQAENQNCCSKPNPESCIFPLRGKGIHDEREGAEKALTLIQKWLPQIQEGTWAHFELEWLANIALMTLGKPASDLPESWRMPDKYTRSDPASHFPQFKNIAAECGVDSFGLSGGAIADDFDGDGDFDIVTSQWDPGKGLRFFGNRGDGTFQDFTRESNLTGLHGGLNLKQADFDNDGDLDILVLRGAWLGSGGCHPNSLIRNDGPIPGGGIHFTDVTFEAGLGEVHYPTQTADWADYDLDGDLDLFIGNETIGDDRYPCQLFRNEKRNGKTYFVDVAASAGIETYRFVKGSMWGDYDGDRFPDLYVSCMGEPNVFYRNQGNGKFQDITALTNTGEPIQSFPTWFWDYNNDGNLDLFVAGYRGSGSEVLLHSRGIRVKDPSMCRLYRNTGVVKFLRVEEEVGLDMPMLSMGSNFGDLSNDGFSDIYLGTGDPDFNSIVPNLLLSNEEGKFYDRTVESRLGHLQKGHAVSMADFDRDGDLDIFEQMGGAFLGDPYYDALFQNPGTKHAWISIALRGRDSNFFGIGSRVRIVVKSNGRDRSIYQWMNSGGSFGANPLELHFGLGDAKKIEAIEVFWPRTGKTQIIDDATPNKRLVISED